MSMLEMTWMLVYSLLFLRGKCFEVVTSSIIMHVKIVFLKIHTHALCSLLVSIDTDIFLYVMFSGNAVMANTQICSDMEEMNCSQKEHFSQCEFASSHVYYNLTLAVTDKTTYKQRNLRHAAEESCYFITCSGAPHSRPTVECSIVEYTCSSPPNTGCQECPKGI